MFTDPPVFEALFFLRVREALEHDPSSLAYKIRMVVHHMDHTTGNLEIPLFKPNHWNCEANPLVTLPSKPVYAIFE